MVYQMRDDWLIRIDWTDRNLKQTQYHYASETTAKEHFAGFKEQFSVLQVTLYNPRGLIIDIHGVLNK